MTQSLTHAQLDPLAALLAHPRLTATPWSAEGHETTFTVDVALALLVEVQQLRAASAAARADALRDAAEIAAGVLGPLWHLDTMQEICDRIHNAIPRSVLAAAGEFHVVVDEDSVYLAEGQKELMMWTQAEWQEEPALVLTIVNAIAIGYSHGPGKLLAHLGG